METMSVSTRKIMSTELELMMDLSSCSLITRPRLMFQLQMLMFFFFFFSFCSALSRAWFGLFELSIGTESIGLGFPIGIGFVCPAGGLQGSAGVAPGGEAALLGESTSFAWIPSPTVSS